MPAPNMRITIEGLPEKRAALRAFDAALPKELQRLNKGFAVRVAEGTRDEYATIYATDTGAHQKAIKATATQTKAQVRLDDKGNSTGLLAQEFHDGSTYPQFRGGTGGAFFYPTVAEMVPDLEGEYVEALGGLMAKVEAA